MFCLSRLLLPKKDLSCFDGQCTLRYVQNLFPGAVGEGLHNHESSTCVAALKGTNMGIRIQPSEIEAPANDPFRNDLRGRKEPVAGLIGAQHYSKCVTYRRLINESTTYGI